jgi:hypothetical protein
VIAEEIVESLAAALEQFAAVAAELTVQPTARALMTRRTRWRNCSTTTPNLSAALTET